jgi:hypothetical protein
MPKAVILFSFKKDDPSPLLKSLSDLQFNRKDGSGIIFSMEFDVNEAEFTVAHLIKIKEKIVLRATHRISKPYYIWKETFKEVGLDKEKASALAGLALANGGTTSFSSLTDTGDSTMSDAPQAVPAAAQPIVAELRQEESQSQGIVDDDFDVDALVSGLANAKIGGRRKTRSTRTFTLRRGGKKSRSKSRRH